MDEELSERMIRRLNIFLLVHGDQLTVDDYSNKSAAWGAIMPYDIPGKASSVKRFPEDSFMAIDITSSK